MVATGFVGGDPRKVDVAGDTMTGDLTLPGSPDQPLEAATKQYVDAAVAGGGTPSGTVVTETAYGQASAAGAAGTFSRGDHTHGTPAAPTVPGPATVVTAETAYGAATAVGTATTYAREDHSHGTPPLGTTAGTAAEGNHTHTASGVGAIPASLLDGKGDVVTATADDTPARLTVGADGQFLRANSATGTGLEWDTATAADVGADASGTAASTVAAHAVAVDPHGDRAYTDAALAGAGAALVFDIRRYGAVLDGTTDDSGAVTAAITAAVAAGGGIVFFPAGVCRINSQILLPNDAGGIPKQAPITFLGTGSRWDGRWQGGGNPPGASVLDLRYSGAVAKIDTRGVGVFAARDLVFTDLGTSSTPFIQTTNTTLFVERCSFYGNPTKSGTTTDQDGIVLGGMTTVLDGTANAPFQGYGTIICGNYFARIRRGVHLRTYANAVVVSENTWSTTCGGDSTVGAIDFSPLAGQTVAGCVIASNLIEVVNYVYGVRAEYASNNSFLANNFYDPGGAHVAYYRFEAFATYNLVLDGARNDTKPLVSETGASVGTNLALTSHQSQVTRFSQPVEFSSINDGLRATGAALFSGGSNRFIIQPATDQNEATPLFLVKRSAVDDVNPGGEILRITQDGGIQFTNSANTAVQFTTGGRTWQAVGTGGAFVIYTGTGGSNLDFRAFAARLMHFTSNTELIRFRISPQSATQGAIQYNITGPIDTAGSGTPEGVVTAPVGSTFRRADGAAGTTFYVKESGAGNTGWIPARLVVGTTVGTVAAGDDSRITGAQARSALTTKGDLYAATASATVVRQPVGSDGQVLRANSAQATGLEWDTLDAADVGAVGHTLADAKGDLLAAAGADTFVRLPVGSDGNVLTADSAQTAGVKWAAPSGGSGGGYRGAWNSGTSYVAGDIVTYRRASYGAVASSTNATPAALVELFPGHTPANLALSDASAYELAVTFTVSAMRRMTRALYYKSDLQDSGPAHVLSLWDSLFGLVASAAVVGETASGIQAAPLVADLMPGRTYYLSYGKLSLGNGDAGYAITTGFGWPSTVDVLTATEGRFSTAIGTVPNNSSTANYAIWPEWEDIDGTKWDLLGRMDPLAWGDTRLIAATARGQS